MRGRCHASTRRRLLLAAALGMSGLLLAFVAWGARDAGATGIPAFARKYRTSCSTCHTAAPKLNVMGEAFRLNGYRFPENDQLLRRDQPVPLGEDPWKDLWPRAIWPGEVSGSVPLAFRVESDVRIGRDTNGSEGWTYRFPHELSLLAASTLGEHAATFVEAEWSREDGLEVAQAKVLFQDLLPVVPTRALNLWIGLQNLYLFTFADPKIDRAGRQPFRWQEFRPADVELRDSATGNTFRSADVFELTRSQPAVELNGLAGGRLFYGLGLAQGAGGQTADNNDHKDVYYKLRYKLGGLGLDGHYAPGAGPPRGGQGQLLDRSVIIETFGYFGAEPAGSGWEDRHRDYGVSVRTLLGPADLGVGYVWGRNDRPWGARTGALRHSSLFGRGEWLAYPWLIGALQAERVVAEADPNTLAPGSVAARLEETRVVPGVIALVRQNVRAVAEGELFFRYRPGVGLQRAAPRNLWLRLDIAF